jgi:hypothetical protein
LVAQDLNTRAFSKSSSALSGLLRRHTHIYVSPRLAACAEDALNEHVVFASEEAFRKLLGAELAKIGARMEAVCVADDGMLRSVLECGRGLKCVSERRERERRLLGRWK